MFHRMTPAVAIALGAASLAGAASSAQAATISIAAAGNNTGGSSYWTDTATFSLPANAINASLNISLASADDRFVVQLNGTDVIATGIFGPGTGSFRYTAISPNDPRAFLANGAQNVTVASGFQAGVNTLLFIVNDTGNGIFGDLVGGSNGTAGPTSYQFNGTITYDLSGGVPEPATWALLILGFGAVGGAMRRRSSTIAVSFARAISLG